MLSEIKGVRKIELINWQKLEKVLIIYLILANVIPIVGIWEIFHYALKNGSALIVPDFGMPYEVNIIFPLLVFFDLVLMFWIMRKND